LHIGSFGSCPLLFLSGFLAQGHLDWVAKVSFDLSGPCGLFPAARLHGLVAGLAILINVQLLSTVATLPFGVLGLWTIRRVTGEDGDRESLIRGVFQGEWQHLLRFLSKMTCTVSKLLILLKAEE